MGFLRIVQIAYFVVFSKLYSTLHLFQASKVHLYCIVCPLTSFISYCIFVSILLSKIQYFVFFCVICVYLPGHLLLYSVFYIFVFLCFSAFSFSIYLVNIVRQFQSILLLFSH